MVEDPGEFTGLKYNRGFKTKKFQEFLKQKAAFAREQKAKKAQEAIKAKQVQLNRVRLGRSAAKAINSPHIGRPGNINAALQFDLALANQEFAKGRITAEEFRERSQKARDTFQAAQRQRSLNFARSAATTAKSQRVKAETKRQIDLKKRQKQNRTNQIIAQQKQRDKVRRDVEAAGFDPAKLQQATGRFVSEESKAKKFSPAERRQNQFAKEQAFIPVSQSGGRTTSKQVNAIDLQRRQQNLQRQKQEILTPSLIPTVPDAGAESSVSTSITQPKKGQHVGLFQGPPDPRKATIPTAGFGLATMETPIEQRPTLQESKLDLEQAFGFKVPKTVSEFIFGLDQALETSKPVEQRSIRNQKLQGVANPFINIGESIRLAPPAVQKDIEKGVTLEEFFGSTPVGQIVSGGTAPKTPGTELVEEKSNFRRTALTELLSGNIESLKEPEIQAAGATELLLFGAGPRATQKITDGIKTKAQTAINQRQAQQIARETAEEGIPQQVTKVGSDRFIIERGTETNPAKNPLTLLEFGKKGKTTFVKKPDDLLTKDIEIFGTIDETTAKSFGVTKKGKNVFTSKTPTPESRLALRQVEESGRLARTAEGVKFPTKTVRRGKASEFQAAANRPEDERLAELILGKKKRPDVTGFFETEAGGFSTPPRNIFGIAERAGSRKAPTLGSAGLDRKLLDVGLSTAKKNTKRTFKKTSTPFDRPAVDAEKIMGIPKTPQKTVTKKTQENIKSQFRSDSPKPKPSTDFAGLPVLGQRGDITTQSEVIAFPPGSKPPNTRSVEDVLFGLGDKQNEKIIDVLDQIIPQRQKRKTEGQKRANKDRIDTFSTQIEQPAFDFAPALGITTKSKPSQKLVPVQRQTPGQTPGQAQRTRTPQRTVTADALVPIVRTPQDKPGVPFNPGTLFFRFPFVGGGQRGGIGAPRKRTQKEFLFDPLDFAVPGVLSRAGAKRRRGGEFVFGQGERELARARKKAQSIDIFGKGVIDPFGSPNGKKSKKVSRRKSLLDDPFGF